MKILKQIALVAVAASSFFATSLSTPANAAIILCTGGNCVNTDANVLVTAGQGSTIAGNYNNSSIGVTFSSLTDAVLVGGANGQASVGAFDELLNQLTFTIDAGFGFTSALFNLEPIPGQAANEAVSVFVNYKLADGTTSSITQSIGTNGQNFIGITGNAGEVFTSAGFTANPGTDGISELKQLRLGGVAAIGAVPEPAAWVMMLLGMAAVGFTMRRKDKNGLRVRFA